MIFTKTGSIPTARYIWVDTNYTHKEPIGYAEALWVQICSIPNRAWGLNVIFRDGGMMYRNIPPWAVTFVPFAEHQFESISPEATQMWNCYSDHYAILECQHLLEMPCVIRTCEGDINGQYLFQTSHLHDSYSAAPDQDKTMIWAVTEEGRLTIFPNNRVYFKDASYTTDSPAKPLILQDNIWQVDESISTK